MSEESAMDAAEGVVCVGGATVDRTYRTQKALRPGTSNPVTSARSFGGVARNVAENLGRLGATVALVSAIGDDQSGRLLLAHLDAVGVDVSHVRTVPGRATAEYVAVVEPSGELAIGLADMAVFDTLTPSGLTSARTVIRDAALVFADCNLPAETLADLIARRREGHSPRLAVDAVSAPKVVRLPDDLTGLDLLFLNKDEAEALLDRAMPAEAAATALRARGVGAVVLTCGSQGVLVADESGTVALPATPVSTVTDVTGAGDALVAAALHRLAIGDALLPAVRAGLSVAALTLQRPGAVRPDLSPTLVEAAVHRAPLPRQETL